VHANVFSSCVSLQEIYFSGCGLTQLEGTIGQLAQLRILEVGENSLDSIPWQIGMAQKLEVVNFSNNRITSLPFQFGYLFKTLRKLGLASNQLKVLPGELGYMTPAINLTVQGNPLQMPFQEFPTDTAALLKTCKPFVKAYPPKCDFERCPASQNGKASAMSEFNVMLNDFTGAALTIGGATITGFLVRRTAENEAAAAADEAAEPESAVAAAGGKAEEDVVLGELVHGRASVGKAVHPTKAQQGTSEPLILKDLKDGTFTAFYNISTPGAYDLWLFAEEVAFGCTPTTMVVSP
jgi:hypothetical protein